MNITGRCVYIVFTNTNLTDGYGSEYPLAVADYKSTATRFAKGKYVMGSDAPVKKVELVQFEGVWYLPVDYVPILKAEKGDKERDEKDISRSEAIERAKKLGLSEDDINLIRSSSKNESMAR